jgi:hypothetical protein
MLFPVCHDLLLHSGSSQGPVDCAAELYHTGQACCCFLQATA